MLNVKDWSRIQRIKTFTRVSTSTPIRTMPSAISFGERDVVPSWNMPESQFLVGSFAMGAAVWDRMEASVEISREHSITS